MTTLIQQLQGLLAPTRATYGRVLRLHGPTTADIATPHGLIRATCDAGLAPGAEVTIDHNHARPRPTARAEYAL